MRIRKVSLYVDYFTTPRGAIWEGNDGLEGHSSKAIRTLIRHLMKAGNGRRVTGANA